MHGLARPALLPLQKEIRRPQGANHKSGLVTLLPPGEALSWPAHEQVPADAWAHQKAERIHKL